MLVWLAVLLFVIVAAGILGLIILMRRKGRKQWMVVSTVALSIALLAIATYIALTLLFPDSAGKQPTGESPGITASIPEASATLMPLAAPQTPSMGPVLPEPKPEEYDLPIDEVPAFYPDVLGLRDVPYEAMPVFGSQNEVTKFVLHNFLNGRFEFELYLAKDFAVDEGTGFTILNRACETAMSYYLFSAYETIDMYTEERGDEDKVHATIKLEYSEPAYDLEARAEAYEFLLKNPVPSGGFQDFESEKAYARKIHDFIARKITYSPIGYDPENMFGMEKYEACQEAYNALAAEDNMAVCAGYARAFALIAQYAGINSAWVFGNETEVSSHAWNVIYPCDGSEAVLVDVTWDDTESDDVPGQTYVSDRYFYIPLSEEYEHIPADYFDEFLRFINEN
ncbi:MAG: transglutaminase domain-containing protein [Christensenellales bacterium]